MSPAFQRIFGIQVPGFSDLRPAANRLSIDQLRQRLQAVIEDCREHRTDRMNYKIAIARTPNDLWLLRSDLHQCVSQAHSQAEAANRINSLVPAFQGWLPASQLTRI